MAWEHSAIEYSALPSPVSPRGHDMSQTSPAANGTPYGTLPAASPLPQRKPVSLPRLQEMRERGEKITMLTAYDATFAAVADAAGVECVLVGDSLGMVCQGLSSTVGVTLQTMRYHVESVVRGLQRVQATTWVLGDLPFGSGDRVAVLISGLGATPLMEQYILYGSVAERLAEAGIEVVVPLVGNFFTSLEMMGVTLSVLKLDDELDRLMRYPCASIGIKTAGAAR